MVEENLDKIKEEIQKEQIKEEDPNGIKEGSSRAQEDQGKIEELTNKINSVQQNNSNQVTGSFYALKVKRGPRKPQRIYESPTEEEMIKFFSVPKKTIHEAAYIVSHGSGPRISEVLNLRPEDFDIKGKKIFIRQGKGKKDRVVNMPKLLKDKHIKCFPLKISVRALESAFLRHSMKAGINSVIGTYTNKKGKIIPLYKYRFHSLRHLFATRALQKGLPINYLQAILGHENISTTNKYTKANPQDAIRAILERDI